MGLVLRGALVGRTPLGTPKPGKSQLYAWSVQDTTDGSRLEVLSSDILGGAGEIVEIEVNPRVKTKLVNGANVLTDSITLWASNGGGGSVQEETDWSVPGRVSPTPDQKRVASALSPSPVAAPLPVGASLGNGSGNGARP